MNLVFVAREKNTNIVVVLYKKNIKDKADTNKIITIISMFFFDLKNSSGDIFLNKYRSNYLCQ